VVKGECMAGPPIVPARAGIHGYMLGPAKLMG
jgi:hypothetical protein